MKYKQFDVVVLNNENRATILGINNNSYNAEKVGLHSFRNLYIDNELQNAKHKQEELEDEYEGE